MKTFRLFIPRLLPKELKILVLLSIAVLTIIGCKPKQATTTVLPILPVGTISGGEQITYLEYPAAIQGKVDIDIRAQVSGYIENILVKEGAYVSAGQTLFKINDSPYREALNNAIAGLHASEAALLNAQLEIDKLTPLVQNKVVSDFQLKTARATYKIARANVDQAKASVESARINLGYTNVKAAVSGYIGRIPKKQGSLVSPTDQLALTQLSDIHEVHVYFALSENDFNNFNNRYPGKTSAERVNRLPEVDLLISDNTVYPFKGKIDMIDGQFDKNTAAITFRASFPNTAGLLRSGNTGKVRLGLKHKDVITVPQSSTIELQDKVFIYALSKDNKVNKQPIEVVGTSGNNYLVKAGIKAGDRIVLKGFETLKEGDVIQPATLTSSNINYK